MDQEQQSKLIQQRQPPHVWYKHILAMFDEFAQLVYQIMFGKKITQGVNFVFRNVFSELYTI